VRANNFFASVFLTLLFSAFATEAQAVKGDPCNNKFMDAKGNLRPDMTRAYVMHELFDIYRKADKHCDGHLTEAEINDFESSIDVTAKIALTEQYVRSNTAAGRPVHLDSSGEPPLTIVPTTIEPTPLPCMADSYFLLRNAAEDVRIFSCPKDFKSATGAQFGYSYDGVAQNISWTAKGFAAADFVWRNSSAPEGPYVAGYAFAPWVSFNRLTNSAASLRSKQTDLLSYGATAELAFGRVLGADQYFRATAQVNSDFEGDAKSWSVTAEWQPVSNDWIPAISAPNPLTQYATWELDPIARSIYSVRLEDKPIDPIFATRGDTFRAGPVLALSILPVHNDMLVPHWLQPTVFTTSFEWLEDFYNHRTYRLLNSTLNFPIDPDGHLGVQLNYQHGQLEETGKRVNQATAGLAAKW